MFPLPVSDGLKAASLASLLLFLPAILAAADADLILHGGKVVTVDAAFSVQEAVAVKNGRIAAVGRSEQILSRERGAQTQIINLEGRTVLPGLADGHVHALGAALSELSAPYRVLRSYSDIQNYIREQAAKVPKGEWIMVPKTFPTRLLEMRMPTREVLDVATEHPVYYDATHGAAVNTYALRKSGITRELVSKWGAQIATDENGEPSGILSRRATPLLKGVPGRTEAFTRKQKLDALEAMLKRYVAAGLTTVTDRGVHPEEYDLYQQLKADKRLPLRVVMTFRPTADRGAAERVSGEINDSAWAYTKGDDWLKFGAFKVGLDGGMNVGTAYMREPYGPFSAQLYGISNPDHRGERHFTPEDLLSVMSAARDKGWQMSAHSQGGGAVDLLLDIFEKLDKERPIAPTRSYLIHASFQSPDSIARAKRMGVSVDVQPAWLYLDGVALNKVMSKEAMRYFNPYRSLVDAGILIEGGTDHMIGWDKNTAINPYNPFLGMWIAITRQTTQGEVIHPEERLTREQALKMYTAWSAYLSRSEKDRGSIEPGKLADMVVIDRDYLTCPEDEIREIEPLQTIIGGRIAYSR
jgi:predicted amidohydrolase YtcJ